MEVKELKTIVKLVKGKKPKSLSEIKSKTHSEPYLLAKVIRGSEEPKFGKEDEMVVVSPDDLVIISDGDAGEVFQGLRGGLASTMSKIELLENISLNYLKYFLISNRKLFSDTRTGAAIPHLNKDVFFNLRIPVPSLQEQEKIVERLDKFFKNKYKSIELKKSISNKFISYYKLNINDLFTQHEKEITISDYVNDSKKDIVDGPFGSNLKREHFVSSGIEVLKLQDIKENNIYKKSKDYVKKDKFLELKRHSFKPNDLILTKLGNPLGICAIVKDQEGLIVADLIRVRCKSLLDAKFLMYQINSLGFQKIINSFQRGATRPRIRISDFRNIKIKTCSTKEKREIVELIEKFDSLKTHYLSNNKLLIDNYLDLNTSVLNKEFSYE